MNNRIKELAEQAGLKHHNWITNESNVKDGDFKYPRLEDYEKFAQLIVAECVGIVAKRKDQAIDDGWNVDEAMSMAEMDLEEHFGVEE